MAKKKSDTVLAPKVIYEKAAEGVWLITLYYNKSTERELFEKLFVQHDILGEGSTATHLMVSCFNTQSKRTIERKIKQFDKQSKSLP